jgi:hypothetical protein
MFCRKKDFVLETALASVPKVRTRCTHATLMSCYATLTLSFMLCYILFDIKSHHITSYHITSHHITSQHIISHHIISYLIISHHIISHHIISYNIIHQFILLIGFYSNIIYLKKRNEFSFLLLIRLPFFILGRFKFHMLILCTTPHMLVNTSYYKLLIMLNPTVIKT